MYVCIVYGGVPCVYVCASDVLCVAVFIWRVFRLALDMWALVEAMNVCECLGLCVTVSV